MLRQQIHAKRDRWTNGRSGLSCADVEVEVVRQAVVRVAVIRRNGDTCVSRSRFVTPSCLFDIQLKVSDVQ